MAMAMATDKTTQTERQEGDTLGFSQLTELRAFSLSHADAPGETPGHPTDHPGLAGDAW